MPDLDKIVDRLARLEAAEAARGLLSAYARQCDTRDPEAVSQLFAPDGVLEVPGRHFGGRHEVRAFYSGAFTDDPTDKTHFITNSAMVWLGGGRTAVHSYFLYTAAGDETSILGWGEYHDVVEVGDEGARFERKAISIRRAVDVREGWSLAVGGK